MQAMVLSVYIVDSVVFFPGPEGELWTQPERENPTRPSGLKGGKLFTGSGTSGGYGGAVSQMGPREFGNWSDPPQRAQDPGAERGNPGMGPRKATGYALI